MVDLEATVLDVGKAVPLGDGARLGAADAELEPEGARAHRDRLPGHLRRVLGPAEDVDDVDWPAVDLVIECIPEKLAPKQALFAELEKRAEEILPESAQVRVLGFGDCVELAPSPSCSQVVFEMDEDDLARRAARVREEARGNDWTVTHSDDAQGGWSVILKKDEFTAVVFLWRPEVYDVDCKGQPDPNSDADRFCFNTLNLSR